MVRSAAPTRELIIPTFTQWERVGSVTSILADLTQGIFFDPALLMDQFMRDDRVSSCWELRMEAVLGLPWHMDAAKARDGRKQSRADKIAEEATALWSKMVEDAELRELYLWGLHIGAGIGRQRWIDGEGTAATEPTPTEGSPIWMPHLQAWHGGGLRFDLSTDRYMLRTYDRGEITLDPNDPNWVLTTPLGYKYGRLRCKLLPLTMLTLDRGWAFRDRARHGEVHGQPIRQGITPLDADQREKDSMRRALSTVGSETAIITPQGTSPGEGKYDVKLVEASSNSHQTFSSRIDHEDRAIAILYFGQSASTEGQPGLGAQEKPGDKVMGYVLRFDAKNIAAIARSVLRPWALYNYGDADLAPELVIEVDPPEDGVEKATEWSTLGDAIDKLERHGIDVDAMLETSGAQMLPEAERAKIKEMFKQAREAAQQQEATPPTKNEPKTP
jgi:hypothetical protein